MDEDFLLTCGHYLAACGHSNVLSARYVLRTLLAYVLVVYSLC